MERIKAIAAAHDLKIIEDCPHAHGSQYKGKRVGNWGDCGTFSFQASKVLNAGEGGMITCNDDDLAYHIYEVLDCGRHPDTWCYAHHVYGSNYRLGEFIAALIRSQLKQYPEQLKQRNEAAIYLNEKLSEISGIHPQNGMIMLMNAHNMFILYFSIRINSVVFLIEKCTKNWKMRESPLMMYILHYMGSVYLKI